MSWHMIGEPRRSFRFWTLVSLSVGVPEKPALKLPDSFAKEVMPAFRVSHEAPNEKWPRAAHG
jgi:hypothetical protein